MQRRNFITTAAAGAATAGMAAPAAAQAKFRWNMVMPWPRSTPGVGVNAERFAQRVTAMSGGRIEIKLYGAGELVPPFGVFDAVHTGTAQIAHGTPYYWASKSPALHWFTGVPFGLTATELPAWLYYGDGNKLWQEAYAPFNVTAFYAGSSGVQAGGWFRKEINSVEDLQGLKIRIAGLGADVMRRLGATTVTTPPGEILQNLLSGAIDAAEWIGPWNDRAFGLQTVAKYYYVPAFHEPGPGLEILVNKDEWNKLPADLQEIIKTAASATANETLADFLYHNIESFGPLLSDGIELRAFPEDVVRAMAKESFEVFEEMAAQDPLTRKVHDSFMAFLKKAVVYNERFDTRLQAMRKLALTQG
ncbi:TRAP transporter substrate-binding protein [Marinimicrococcus flavescens]|uniref:TRAP transporter substrate-binding protein n=1 Tax=Marinimicrococcus flavescens TaxID=3031815 RepID=A0AAP3XST9_9PROT|nr:TRAP transporter substrate-binding protein [Marinimicrococcus flavescens]